jgi:hypothetical protein
MHMKRWVATVGLVAGLASCAAGVGPQKPTAPMEELWIEPPDLSSRDLFYGSGGPSLAPRPDAQYEVEKRDTSGFSITYDVRDEKGQEWSVKIGPEAQPEVVSNRIVWALGYHQAPSYYVPKWTYKNADTAPVHGRFRPKVPWLKSNGVWDWNKNPFVGTEPLKGLKVLMMVLNNSDLKPLQNAIYDVHAESGPHRWFVVKDLGATLGETGAVNPRRGWLEGFEKHGFITHVDENGSVKFEFHGLRGEMFNDLTVSDVAWTCGRLERLSRKQWEDAFRAGGYDADTSARFIARIQQKIQQGKALTATR